MFVSETQILHPVAPATANKLPPDLDPDRTEFKVEEK
jgi:hypothetical protein